VKMVSRGMGLDQRIGEAFLNPGPGYGGSCFPKDTEAFAALGRARQAPLRIVQSVIEANQTQWERCAERVLAALGESPSDARVGVLGLSFKPDTDDMREAPAVPILRAVLDAGAKVQAYDPEAMDNARELLPEVDYCEDTYAAVDGVDLVVILTEWNEFRALDWGQAMTAMRRPRVLDLRNLYDPETMRGHGIEYACVGRPTDGSLE